MLLEARQSLAVAESKGAEAEASLKEESSRRLELEQQTAGRSLRRSLLIWMR